MQHKWFEQARIKKWVEGISQLASPNGVIYCDGSKEEWDRLSSQLIEKGTFTPLNPKLHPGSFYARSHPDDVARVEECTYICSTKEEDAGPTNNWKDPTEMMLVLKALFKGCMKGRTMYVVPFCMGPLQSPYSKFGIQITDSPYVVCCLRIMTRMGSDAGLAMGEKEFVPCVHSVGAPLHAGVMDSYWPCNPENKYIVHFPESREIWSFGSGYGGNALLCKKGFALRIASCLARDEKWMAEHMLILGITAPTGAKKYFAAAFPSACGKTNLAMLRSELPGWKVECVGDDIAWMHVHKGELRGINPEAGFFGVAPGTSMQTNPSAMVSLSKNTIFTNVGLTDEGDVWWEGMTPTAPKNLMTWKGKRYDGSELAAHPNSRFTCPARQCPTIDPDWENPSGVPISAIIFGGRRATTEPLVREALSWNHGVFMGATLSSEQTAAAKGVVGQLRHDPFAMLPFCGYNMGDYFAHWIAMGKKLGDHAPKIFHVNWFLKDESGNMRWPGYGENMRVLKWMFERIDEDVSGSRTKIGILPKKGELGLDGVDEDRLFEIKEEEWENEAKDIGEYFKRFGHKLPHELLDELKQL